MRTPVIIAAVAALASLSCLKNDFVWNSDELIKRPETRTLRSALGLFAPGVWAQYRGDSGENYHPVAALTFYADRALWGTGPSGCHLSNLLLHVAVCVLVWAVTKRLTGSAAAAAGAGLLFAVHPVHIESVNWLKNRSQLTAVALAMGAVAIALPSPRSRVRALWQCLAATVCLGAALLAQEQAVGVAVVIACICWLAGPQPRPGRLACATVVLALAALYVYMRFTVFQFQDKVGIPLDYLPGDTGTRWTTCRNSCRLGSFSVRRLRLRHLCLPWCWALARVLGWRLRLRFGSLPPWLPRRTSCPFWAGRWPSSARTCRRSERVCLWRGHTRGCGPQAGRGRACARGSSSGCWGLGL